jgi:hypothetical protein
MDYKLLILGEPFKVFKGQLLTNHSLFKPFNFITTKNEGIGF